MAKQDNGRKLSTEDVIHIGMATKDPGAYMIGTLAYEICKLPFVLIGAAFGMIREGREAKRKQAEAQRLADEAEAARQVAQAKAREEYAIRMAQRGEEKRLEIARREAERKKQEILQSMMIKPSEPEIKVQFGEDLEAVTKGKSAPDCYIDSYLFGLELIRMDEVRQIVSSGGLSPELLEAKLSELHEQNKQLAGTGGGRLTPRVKKTMALAGKRAKARFSGENPGASGTVKVTVVDLYEGMLATEGFVKELEPVWEHLRKMPKTSQGESLT